MTGKDGSRRVVNAVTRSHDAAPDVWSLQAVDPIVLSTTPKSGPRAGKAFVVRPVRLNLPPGEAPASGAPRPDRYSCVSMLGDRFIPGSGAGGCTLRIAKRHTHGKTLLVLVTASYRGATTSFPFKFVVS